MVGGAMPTTFGGEPLLRTPIVAEAADGYATLTGDTLTIGGDITSDIINQYRENSNVKHIVAANDTVLPTDSSYLFYAHKYDGKTTSVYWANLETVDLSKADAINVTRMDNMFYKCSKLESIDLSGLNAAKVTTMQLMFGDCESLKSINLCDFNTSKVENLSYLFCDCKSLTSLDLSSLNTENVTKMDYMFQGCSKLESIDLSGLNTAKVTSMEFMFGWCESLKSINFGNFNTSKVENLSDLFFSCKSLTSLDLSSFDTSLAQDTRGLFYDCGQLRYIIVSDNWDMSNVTYSKNMFYRCDNLRGQNGYKPTDVFAEVEDLDKTYARIDREGTPGYLSEPGYSPSIVEFDSTSGTLFIGGWVNLDDISKYKQVANVKHVKALEGTVLPQTSSFMFNGFNGVENEECWAELETIDFSKADTSKVTNMECMFQGCKNLKSIDLSSFNTSNVTSMKQMFLCDSSLETLDLGSFDTKNVADMSSMFSECSKLKQIYVSDKWSTESVTDSGSMFAHCYFLVGKNSTAYSDSNTDASYAHIDEAGNPGYLTDVKVSLSSAILSADGKLTLFGNIVADDVKAFRWDNSVKKVYAAPGSTLPDDCTELFKNFMASEIDLTQLDTSNVTKMNSMFFNCSNLTQLNLSGFDTSNVTDMRSMFASCTNLERVVVSDKWSTSKIVTDDDDPNLDDMASGMFASCTSIRGERHTEFDSKYTDSEYARIDTVTKPGYFWFNELNITRVEGVSLTLEGNLDVNFYIASFYVKKAVLNGPTGEIVFNSDQINAAMSNGLIKLSYPVNATQANAKVSLKLYDYYDELLDVYNSSFVLDPDKTIEYSVNDYLAAAKPEKNWHSADKANFNTLLKATKNYVDAADNFFNGAKNTISDVSSIDVFKDSDYGNADYLKGNKMALVLNSETAVRIFYNGDETSATLKQFDDNGHLQITGTLEKKNNKDGDYFEIANIPAHKLCDIIVLDIGNKELMFNPLEYGWRVKKYSSDEKLKTLCCALYDYANAATKFNSDFGNV